MSAAASCQRSERERRGMGRVVRPARRVEPCGKGAGAVRVGRRVRSGAGSTRAPAEGRGVAGGRRVRTTAPDAAERAG
jgi:hypothetical protein